MSKTICLQVPAIHPALVDVALIDAPTCAAAGAVSKSWWYAEVAAGRAPAPVVQGNRFSRWRLADVREFWRKRADLNGTVG